jgi:hypothetical protein
MAAHGLKSRPCPAALNAAQTSRSASIAAMTIDAIDLIHLQS